MSIRKFLEQTFDEDFIKEVDKEYEPAKLKDDCHYGNVRKDEKGKIFLIDTQGQYAFDRM